ncbi:MAG TPA: alpha/beta fold hydrolase [Pseudonocardia sp.]
MEQRVEFPSDGQTLVGTLFRPDGAEGPLPTVVAAGGWCYVKEIVLPHVGRIVADQNVQFLAFDYAGFGESSGTRRQHLDPWQQISDYRNAITYVENRDDADADRIGVFGLSYSGGHVLILAAIDPRVKAAVSIVPVVDGYNNVKRAHGEARFRELEQVILQDRRQRATGAGGNQPMSTMTPFEELTVWPYPRTYEVFNQLKETEAPRHEHWNTIESVELLLNYDVSPYLPRILDKKIMMIVAEGDILTMWDLEIAAFHKIPSPHKRLEILPAVSHMSLYSEREDTNIAGQLSAEWFSEHLSGK